MYFNIGIVAMTSGRRPARCSCVRCALRETPIINLLQPSAQRPLQGTSCETHGVDLTHSLATTVTWYMTFPDALWPCFMLLTYICRSLSACWPGLRYPMTRSLTMLIMRSMWVSSVHGVDTDRCAQALGPRPEVDIIPEIFYLFYYSGLYPERPLITT